MLMDLYSTLCDVGPRGEPAFYGMPIPGGYPYWLAIDAEAFPAFLVSAKPDDFRPEICLRAVNVFFSRNCVIESDTQMAHQGCYSLIQLKESNPAIVRLFLRILEESFCNTRPPNDNGEIAARIQQIAALFSRIDIDSRDLIGLWGELYVISCAPDTDAAVRCWSSRKTAKYDFVTDNFVLDVKTTVGAKPQHRFSLEQLRPPRICDAYIASLCVTEVPNGQIVGDLIDHIVAKLKDQDLRSAFLMQCLNKGGPDLYRSKLALQRNPSKSLVSIFRARDIPVPQVSSMDPIDNVRFDVELSGLVPLSEKECASVLTFEVDAL